MNFPRITLITATYNSGNTLVGTIESVLNQDYEDLEYIIVDGGSTDQTLDIIRSYEPRFGGRLKWVSEKDDGIYDAWNKGIKMSTGKWIGFIGSDDILYDHALRSYSKVIIENTEINYISSYAELVSGNLEFIRLIGKAFGHEMVIHNAVAHVGSLHRRDLFENYGLYSIQYDISSDYDFLLRCYNNITSGFLPEVTVKMRFGGISNSSGCKALEESLRIKLNYNLRNKILCYFDFYYSVLKYKLRKIIKGY